MDIWGDGPDPPPDLPPGEPTERGADEWDAPAMDLRRPDLERLHDGEPTQDGEEDWGDLASWTPSAILTFSAGEVVLIDEIIACIGMLLTRIDLCEGEVRAIQTILAALHRLPWSSPGTSARLMIDRGPACRGLTRRVGVNFEGEVFSINLADSPLGEEADRSPLTVLQVTPRSRAYDGSVMTLGQWMRAFRAAAADPRSPLLVLDRTDEAAMAPPVPDGDPWAVADSLHTVMSLEWRRDLDEIVDGPPVRDLNLENLSFIDLTDDDEPDAGCR